MIIMSYELHKNGSDVAVPCFRGTTPAFSGKEWEMCNKAHSGYLVSVWSPVLPNTKKEDFSQRDFVGLSRSRPLLAHGITLIFFSFDIW